MENNPKKSKAFIISFILILLLLIGAYYLFKNKDSIFDAKGSTSVSKIFAPLLGTSKNKNLTVIVDPNSKGPASRNNNSITGVVITDNMGNRIVRAEAGEDIKKCDAVYISGFNANKDPIVMRAIANNKDKSLVLGFAGSDIAKGAMGDIIVEGTVNGCNTDRTEGTKWKVNDTIYLSDVIPGGTTKNKPLAPSFVVAVGSVIKVDRVTGSIRVGGATSINMDNLRGASPDISGYLSSIFGIDLAIKTGGFTLNPINIPGIGGYKVDTYPEVTLTATSTNINSGDSIDISWTSKNATSCDAGKGNGTGTSGTFKTGALTKSKLFSVICVGPNGSRGGNILINVTTINDVCINGADNPTLCTTKNGACINNATNPPSCNTDGNRCLNGTDNFPLCTTIGGKCKGGETNPPLCTVINNKCTNGTDNPPLCTTIGGKCPGGETNPPLCTTIDNKCTNGFTNPPLCMLVEFKIPVITVTAPETIDYDKTAFISWTSTNTSSCEAGTGNGTGVNGSFTTPALKVSKSFTVTCIASSGLGRMAKTVFIIVKDAPADTTGGDSTKPQCSDGKDNNDNGLIDEKDPKCHMGGVLSGEYVPTNDSESVAPIEKDTGPSICKIIDANPLTYTDAEQRELDELLRKFYLLASTLKTDSDLSLAYREIEEYKALVEQVKYLTNQCYDQIKDPAYTGPKIQFGNPWFKYDSRGSYLPSSVVLESSCKYCEPNIKNGLYCGNLPQTKDQTVPFCEPNGKELRASGNYARYMNQFGIPAFGTPNRVVNTGNPLTGWTKAALTYINPVAGVISWIWPKHFQSPGPTLQYTNLQDFEKILNVW
ncbi:hypothetical protein HXX01_00180 [Candidatus Nomurabacteria bacterium]|nr:hypothetical protein [Candidatus Nomurabacteria bacterium]